MTRVERAARRRPPPLSPGDLVESPSWRGGPGPVWCRGVVVESFRANQFRRGSRRSVRVRTSRDGAPLVCVISGGLPGAAEGDGMIEVETKSEFRLHSRQVIAAVLDGLPPAATLEDAREAVRAAYPFAEKKGWAHTCWRREVKLAFGLGGACAPRSGVALSPWGVFCPHCSPLPEHRRPRGGCILCAALRGWLAGMAGRDLLDWRSLLAASGADPAAAMALADWLEERGCPVKG